MKVLVTGGAGYVGSHAVALLAKIRDLIGYLLNAFDTPYRSTAKFLYNQTHDYAQFLRNSGGAIKH